MTDFELAREYMHRALTKFAEVQQYNWDADFCKSEIKDSHDKLAACGGYRKINPHNLTKEEMVTLGFKPFDENLTVIPLWLFNHIEDGLEFKSISGGTIIFTSEEQDNDHRLGCVSFGIETK